MRRVYNFLTFHLVVHKVVLFYAYAKLCPVLYIIRESFITVSALAQLVESLGYQPEGRGFDSLKCNWNFLLTLSCRPYCGPEFDRVADSNEYQDNVFGSKGGRCLGLTTLPFYSLLEASGPDHAWTGIAVPLSSYPSKMNGWPPSGAKVKNEWSCTSAPCIYSHYRQGELYLHYISVTLAF